MADTAEKNKNKNVPPRGGSDGASDDERDRLDHLPGESVKVIAQTVGIENLSDEVARALAPDVEYRLREVIQDACKFMRHSKRTELSTEDVNCSLKLRNVEALYGFPAGAGPISFKEVPGEPGLFYQEQTEIKLQVGAVEGRGLLSFEGCRPSHLALSPHSVSRASVLQPLPCGDGLVLSPFHPMSVWHQLSFTTKNLTTRTAG